MDYHFVPGSFVGKLSDDNTVAGLLRRMLAGGQNASIVDPARVTISTTAKLPEEVIQAIEAHYGARQV
jgi:hypothetical protein